MAYVPGFTNDIFISYSHLDDRAVDGAGWVSEFHQRLQIEIEEELGDRVQIWRDRRIGRRDDFGRISISRCAPRPCSWPSCRPVT